MNSSVLLFGGSFDPPHLGHLLIGQWVTELLGAPVRFLPNGTPPHKIPNTPPEARLTMLKLALFDNPRLTIDKTELCSQSYNYTVDTLRRHRAQGVMRDDLYFVLGSDALNSLGSWREPREIIQLCTLVVFPRQPIMPNLVQNLRAQGAKLIITEAPMLEISSSLVRQRVYQGKSIRYLVPDAVEEFIKKSGLYKEEKA